MKKIFSIICLLIFLPACGKRGDGVIVPGAIRVQSVSDDGTIILSDNSKAKLAGMSCGPDGLELMRKMMVNELIFLKKDPLAGTFGHSESGYYVCPGSEKAVDRMVDIEMKFMVSKSKSPRPEAVAMLVGEMSGKIKQMAKSNLAMCISGYNSVLLQQEVCK